MNPINTNIDTQLLVSALERVRRSVEAGGRFVCTLIWVELLYDCFITFSERRNAELYLLELVKCHIGEVCTMEEFVLDVYGHAQPEVVKQHRLWMIDNMLKMVKGEPYV
jgi:hypothetical protein